MEPPPPPLHYLEASSGKPSPPFGGLVSHPRDEPGQPHPSRSPSAVGYEILGGTIGYLAGLVPLITGSPDLVLFTLPLGVSLGVFLAGAGAGGDGDFGAAFLGQIVGTLIAVPFMLAGVFCSRDCEAGIALGVSAAVVFPIGGAVVGYEMSNEVVERAR